MQQGVEQDNRGREHSVGLRVGVSVGEPSRENGDYFGDPVIGASRLCAPSAATRRSLRTKLCRELRYIPVAPEQNTAGQM